MHVLSAEQFSTDDLGQIFADADRFRNLFDEPFDTQHELAGRHIGRSLCNSFYEPSTRTRISFGRAANALGVSVQQTENAAESSSAAKGETLEDTIRVLDEYRFDIIVLRHPETGAANRAASVSRANIINAGDGTGEHPTQSLLDAYTIQRDHGRLDNLHVVMGGDLKHGRTVRSLAKLLSRFDGNKITFVSTPDLQMSKDVLNLLDERGTDYEITADAHMAVSTADVVYWTRLQKERMQDKKESANQTRGRLTEMLTRLGLKMGTVTSLGLDNYFTIDHSLLVAMPSHTTIMHPLPRVGEIDPAIDGDPRARYFEQAGNGLFIRMALIDRILTV
jgi:aspartate carbamoyltransferase catalytic subunit